MKVRKSKKERCFDSNADAAENGRKKRDYREYLLEAKGYDEETCQQAEIAIGKLEVFLKGKPFSCLTKGQVIEFKKWLLLGGSGLAGRPLSRTYVDKILKHCRLFYHWIRNFTGYQSDELALAVEYFQSSKKDRKLCAAAIRKPTPKLEELRRVVAAMPCDSVLERRDRAVVATLLLTGARDDALASLLLRHVNLDDRIVYQKAPEVRTKNAKSIETNLFPIGFDIESILFDWIGELVGVHGFSPDDPLFPPILRKSGENGLLVEAGLSREVWKTAHSVRKIFREACSRVGLPYRDPHSVRRTLTQIGQKSCKTPEEFKAWSQNLGHERVTTTLANYGHVEPWRQAEIMEEFRHRQSAVPQTGASAPNPKCAP